jgi:hypothetical protein
MRYVPNFAPHLAIFCLASLAPASALAYHPLTTDDTGTQGQDGNQIELGHDHTRNTVAGVVSLDRDVPFTYTRGLTDNLDVSAGIARITSPVHGWSNIGLGAKWRFCGSESSKLRLGLKPEIFLPVSAADEAAGLGNGKTSYGLTFMVTQETGYGELHMNLAAERDNFADPTIPDRRNLYRASIAPVWSVSEHWKLALDLGLKTNPDSSEKARMGYVELGVVYSPTSDLDLSLGSTHDVMDGPEQSSFTTLKLTWRFH